MSKPWEEEPNIVIREIKGYECIILRQKAGFLCGYVRIPEGSIFRGIRYNEDINQIDKSIDELIDVHGGVTYSGGLDEKKGWYIGFDCAHAYDLVPETMCDMSFIPDIGGGTTYRTIDYVNNEIEKMVDQIIELEELYG